MKQIVLGNDNLKELFPSNNSLDIFEMNGISMTVGLIDTPDIKFDSEALENNYNVFVKIKAFSCNYRDKSIMLSSRKKMIEKSKEDDSKVLFKAFGSDFMAQVISVGKKVTSLKKGDRVISDSSYPFFETTPGIPTNYCSQEYMVFHQSKLIKIPEEISDEVGAAFTIGGITSYSMVRKLNIQDGDRILVTAAKSNTSLFALKALQKYKNVKIYATSTTENHKEKLIAMGIKDLIIIDPVTQNFSQNSHLMNIIMENKMLFNKIIDPFFDLHLSKVISVMDHFGIYISCGQYNQYESYLDDKHKLDYKNLNVNLYHIFQQALLKNIEIITNCLGLREDLRNAIDDCANGIYDVEIDSVFSGDDIKGFLDRTYNENTNRFGKVVYKF